MRLAYVCSDPGIPPGGTKGAAVHFREMARALRLAGADLGVFMARSGSWPDHEVRVVKRKTSSDGDRELAMIAANDAMIEALNETGPYDGVYERLSTFGIAGSTFAKTAGIPLILEVNAPLWDEDARYRELEHYETAREMAMTSLARADRVLAVSAELARILVAEGVDANRIEVVPNGVRRDTFESATPHDRPFGGRPVLTFIGSLKPWHGIEFLLEAFEHSRGDRNVGLWIVGDGTLRDMVEQAARAHPKDIHWSGAVSHEQIPGVLLASDVTVAPYTEDAPSYFCPLKVVEALASGCPLLASDVPCVVEVAADHPGVRTFRTGDVASFRSALADILQNPPPRPTAIPEELTWDHKARCVLQWFRNGAAADGPTDQTAPR